MSTRGHPCGQVTTRDGCHVSEVEVYHGHRFPNHSIGHGKPTLQKMLHSYVHMCIGVVARAIGTALSVYVAESRQ